LRYSAKDRRIEAENEPHLWPAMASSNGIVVSGESTRVKKR